MRGFTQPLTLPAGVRRGYYGDMIGPCVKVGDIVAIHIFLFSCLQAPEWDKGAGEFVEHSFAHAQVVCGLESFQEAGCHIRWLAVTQPSRTATTAQQMAGNTKSRRDFLSQP